MNSEKRIEEEELAKLNPESLAENQQLETKVEYIGTQVIPLACYIASH